MQTGMQMDAEYLHFARMCNIGNLVMHFPKIVYIPWYLVVVGLGAGLHNSFKEGDFFSMPLNQIIPIFNKKYPCTASGKTFIIFV